VLKQTRLVPALACAWLGGVGCYSYVPLARPDPEPGIRVAAALTDSGTDALGRYLGPDVAQVDGRVLRLTPDTLVLSAQSVTSREGIDHFWKGEQVTLPRGLIATMVQRRFAAGRTAVFTTGAVVGIALVLKAFGILSSGSSNPMPPPTGQ
jgi:hypothetical protein